VTNSVMQTVIIGGPCWWRHFIRLVWPKTTN